MKRLRLIVSGRVQGVGFRWAAQNIARQLGVHGYVRNLPNGDVEIVVEGDDSAVDNMITWARKGPAWSRVAHLQLHDLPGPAEHDEFEVRP